MMKQFLLKGVRTRWAGSAAAVLLALGVFGSLPAAAQITSTKHNLSGTSGGIATATFTPTSGTGELCVFCHTPHGADTGAAVPLWNRNISTPPTYQTYNSLGTSSLDGATTAVGSVSLACLSCHDGTTAMNVLINAPGSGGYNAAGAAWAGTWSGPAATSSTDGRMTAGRVAMLGTDLRNDHPIGIQYGGGPRLSTSLPAVGTPYTDFRDADFVPAQSATLNGQPVWWVDTGAQGNGRQKTDMQLYTRATAYIGGTTSAIASTVPQPYVECASCHDPHIINATFLRIVNTGSALCLACHIK